VAPVEARLRAEIARVHGAAWADAWHRGLPNYVDVPGGVNVQEIVRLWHFAKALDLADWARMRYNLMGNAGHWFPGSNAASFDPAAIRAALAGHPFAERIPEILAEAHAMLHGDQRKRLSEGG
jgi:predicted aldo/keto reductase-like oxidoreductase